MGVKDCLRGSDSMKYNNTGITIEVSGGSGTKLELFIVIIQ